MKLWKIALLWIGSGFLFPAMGQITEQAASALKAGDASKLAELFTDPVDLAIQENEDVYSRDQGLMILKKFFAEHKPTDFRILHKGQSKSGIEYVIGNLVTSTGTYRVSFYIKTESDTPRIQQLMIDLE